MSKSEVAKNGNIVSRAFNKIGHGVLWTGVAVGRISTFALAAVPTAAFTAEVVNAFTRSTRGYDVAPSYIADLHKVVDPTLESSSMLTQTAGLLGRACLASAEVAGTVAGWGGDVVGVIASHSGEQEPVVDTAGRVLVNNVIAAGAGAAAAKILSIPISHPSRQHV